MTHITFQNPTAFGRALNLLGTIQWDWMAWETVDLTIIVYEDEEYVNDFLAAYYRLP